MIGDNKLYVIDLSPDALLDNGEPADTPKALDVLETVTLPTTVNDVSFCGGYLALSANGVTKVDLGSVTIYSRYLREEASGLSAKASGEDAASWGYYRRHVGSLEKLAQFTVGEWCVAWRGGGGGWQCC
jgi:hypothetical protein